MARARVDLDDQWVDVTSDAKPDSIALDPFRVTWDWDWRDNTDEAWVGTIHAPDVVVDWPFLKQENRSRTIVALAPRIWYSNPQGLMAGLGVRTNYMGLTDIHHGLVGASSRLPAGPGVANRLQFRAQADDVYLAPFMPRPLMGVEATAAFLDGIARGSVTRRWDLSPFVYANGPLVHAAATISGTYPAASELLPEQWTDAHVTELAGRVRVESPVSGDSSSMVFTLDAGAGLASGRLRSVRSGGYGRALASIEQRSYLRPGAMSLTLRANAGVAHRAPAQRMIFVSSADPFETFTNNYWRPRGALLKQPDLMITPAGGARIRGFAPTVALTRVASINADFDQRLTPSTRPLAFWAGLFGDVGIGVEPGAAKGWYSGAGVSLRARGRVYDRDVDVRLSIPVLTNGELSRTSDFRWTVDWR